MKQLLITLLSLALFSCKQEQAQLETFTVKKIDLEYHVTEIGTILPADKVMTNSLAKGSILELKEHGTPVKKGDILLRVSTDAAETRIEERQNGLVIDKIQEQVLNKERELILFEEDEKVKLKKKQYETALFEYQYSKALPLASTVRSLEIELELAKIDLENTFESYNENKNLLDKGFITQTAFAPYERRVKTSQERIKELELKLEIEKKGISKEELVELKTNASRAEKEFHRAEIAKKRRLLDLKQRQLVVQNRIEKSHHEIARAEKDLKNTTLTAENSGGLFLRHKYRDWRSGGRYFHYAVGQDISRNTLVAEIIDESQMNIHILFNEADFRNFKENKAVEIFIPAIPDQKFTGTISSVSEVGKDRNEALKTGQGKSQISLYSAIVDFDSNGKKLHAGMTAHITLKLKDKKSSLALARQALYIENNQQYVFIKSLNSLEKKAIKAKIADDFYLQVLEGLEEGDEVILNAKEAYLQYKEVNNG